MHLIIATEIWGRTPHFDAMAKSLTDIATSITVIDPYDGTHQNFATEEEAYNAFINTGGHEAYAKLLAESVAESEEPAYLLGFSAGAGAVWSAACKDACNAKAAWGFYSSSIHKMMELEPSIPVELIFPDSETHFDVETVARDLQDKPNVQSYITPFAHGFLNPVYDHYDPEVFAFWLQWIKGQIHAAAQQN